MSEFRTEQDLWMERFKAEKMPRWRRIKCEGKGLGFLRCKRHDDFCGKYWGRSCCLNCLDVMTCAQACEIAREANDEFWKGG